MLRDRRIVLLPILVGLAVLSVSPASAGAVEWTLGLKEQYVALTRTLKTDQGRVETPATDFAWMKGVVFNAAYGRLFAGASYATATFTDSEFISAGSSIFVKGVHVDLSELNLAVGYALAAGLNPYIGYVHQNQRTDLRCLGCVGRVDFGNIGAGLLMNYSVPDSRSAVYLNAAFIQGFSLEGGLSYAGTRWPLTGTAGYAYRRIDYPSGEASCGQVGFDCFRSHDVLSGPTVAIHYIF